LGGRSENQPIGRRIKSSAFRFFMIYLNHNWIS
jgi:hypothetical protein